MAETDDLLTIGEVASISNTPATTLRYYEKCGLKPSGYQGARP